jgi:hypothetical protein
MIAATSQALADPVSDRAVAGAKDYVKSNNLKEAKLTILLSSLYNNSFPDFARKWEELTGVRMEIVPLGYTDIPAKIMQEGVAKTGIHRPRRRRRQGHYSARQLCRQVQAGLLRRRRRLEVPAVPRRQALHPGQ